MDMNVSENGVNTPMFAAIVTGIVVTKQWMEWHVPQNVQVPAIPVSWFHGIKDVNDAPRLYRNMLVKTTKSCSKQRLIPPNKLSFPVKFPQINRSATETCISLGIQNRCNSLTKQDRFPYKNQSIRSHQNHHHVQWLKTHIWYFNPL